MPTKNHTQSVVFSVKDTQERAVLEKLDRCRPNKKGSLIKTILYYALCTEERGSVIDDVIKQHMGDDNQPQYRRTPRRKHAAVKNSPPDKPTEPMVHAPRADQVPQQLPIAHKTVPALASLNAVSAPVGILPELAGQVDVTAPVELIDASSGEEDDGALLNFIR